MPLTPLECVLVPVSLVAFISYHGVLLWRINYNPSSTVIGFNHRTRRFWILKMMPLTGSGSQGKDIVAVQTIRNLQMAASFLASTSILLASTLAGFCLSGERSSPYSKEIKFFVSSPEDGNSVPTVSSILEPSISLLDLKFFSLIVVFLVSFFCYTQSIRLYNHCNFIINLPRSFNNSGGNNATNNNNPTNDAIVFSSSSGGTKNAPVFEDGLAYEHLVEYVIRSMEKASNFYTTGTRVFYLAILLFMWIFSCVLMFSFTCLFVLVLYNLDKIDSLLPTPVQTSTLLPTVQINQPSDGGLIKRPS